VSDSRPFSNYLVQTDLPLKAIAVSLNYGTEFYFMQVFKKSVGRTPTQWRTFPFPIDDKP